MTFTSRASAAPPVRSLNVVVLSPAQRRVVSARRADLTSFGPPSSKAGSSPPRTTPRSRSPSPTSTPTESRSRAPPAPSLPSSARSAPTPRPTTRSTAWPPRLVVRPSFLPQCLLRSSASLTPRPPRAPSQSSRTSGRTPSRSEVGGSDEDRCFHGFRERSGRRRTGRTAVVGREGGGERGWGTREGMGRGTGAGGWRVRVARGT